MGWSAAEPYSEDVECRERRLLMEIHTVGIDLGKTLFHLVGVDSSGSVVLRKRCSRSQLLAFTALSGYSPFSSAFRSMASH